jgi:Rieske 2Fe-2S family protein
LHGLFGKPWLNLEPLLDVSAFPELDAEITKGLSLVPVLPTGGSLKWMGVTAPWLADDPYVDYGQVIEAMDDDALLELVSLSDDPGRFDRARLRDYRFGDETDNPLSPAQYRYLVYRHGVYFPWKASYHLLSNDKWEDKHSGKGKSFAEEAERVFPKTVAYVKSLPFREIGRCVVFGIHENDHAPAHRDTQPGAEGIAQHISFTPGGERCPKRLYVCGDGGEPKHIVDAPIYWFNDMDWHGVEADPYFRYSVRVDGVLTREFERDLRRLAGLC